MKTKDFNINIGNRIRNQREKLGYSREKLAELADMSDGYLGEVERGTKGISSSFLYKISVSLGVTMDYLATGEEGDNNSKEKDIESILFFLRTSEKSELLLIEKIIRAIVIDD